MVDSCLIEGRKGMDRAVLEVVASKAVATKHDVKRYVQCTLLAATKDFQVCHRQRIFLWHCGHLDTLPWPCLALAQMFLQVAHF